MSLERSEQLGTPVGLGRGTFWGKNISVRSVAGVTLTDYAYAPGAACPLHYHEHAYLSLLLSGSYIERAGRAERQCVPMTGLYHPAGELHRDTFAGRGGRLFSIELPPSWISRLDGCQIVTQSASWLNRPDASALMLRIHAELGSPDPLSDLLLEGLMMEVLATLPRRPGAAATRRWPPWLPGVQSYLEAHVRQSPGLSAIAAIAGVHPVEVARGFRAHLKCSVGEYAAASPRACGVSGSGGNGRTINPGGVAGGFCRPESHDPLRATGHGLHARTVAAASQEKNPLTPRSDLPPPPVRWRPRTFAAISLAVSIVAVFWCHIEIMRHNGHVGYAEALRMAVHSDRWWLDVLLAAGLSPLYFLSIWSWWRLWRRGRTKAERFVYNCTKVLGTLVAAYFVRLIVVVFAATPAALMSSPGLLVVLILLASAYAVPVGLWVAWWSDRMISGSLVF